MKVRSKSAARRLRLKRLLLLLRKHPLRLLLRLLLKLLPQSNHKYKTSNETGLTIVGPVFCMHELPASKASNSADDD